MTANPEPELKATAGGSARLRWCSFALSVLLVSLPLASVRRPPSSDLPQQFHQVVLAERTLQGLEPELEVNFLAPNRLGYVPLGLGWFAGGAREGPRVAMLIFGLLWVGAIHLFSWRARIDVANAVFATTFLFNRLLYCGFFNFLCGIAGMLLWLRELERDTGRDSSLRLAGGAFAASLLLLLAHVFWFVAGFAIGAAVLLWRRAPWRDLVARAAGIAPVAWLFVRWSGELGGNERAVFESAVGPLERISSIQSFSTLVLGGLRTSIEPVAASVALIFILAGGLQMIRARRVDTPRRALLVAGLACFLAAVLLPTQIDLGAFVTVFVNARWAPFSMVFLLLAVPIPNVRPALARALAFAMLAAMSVATTAAWLRFEREDLAGFEETIQALPDGAMVVGIDLAGLSPYLVWHPYEHLVAWAGVERNARLSMSFVQLESSLVTLRDPAHPPSWLPPRRPDRILVTELANYDFALVRGVESRLRELRGRAWASIVRSNPPWSILSTRRVSAPEPERGPG